MKPTIYTTDNYGFMREREAFPSSEELAGVLTLNVDDDGAKTGFDGFGVALTGSSCYILNKMPETARNELLEKIYGKNGLGLSVARLTIGASDYSPEVYCYEDEQGNFTIGKDREYVLPVVKEVAEKYRDVRFFASPWSPPARMKTGESMFGGFMRDKFVPEYADYILNYIDAYAREGVKISAITVQNETETDQGGKSAACIWNPETEAAFAFAFDEKQKNRADKADKVKIMLLDHNFSIYKRVIWQYENFPELRKIAPAVAFHYYAGGADLAEKVTDRFPETEWHFTEGGPRLYDNYATDWCKWGSIMCSALNRGAKSFTGWNLALDETGGPNVGPFGCGGLVTVNSASGELSFSGQYRAFDHFSRFIKRGAKVLKSSVEGEDHGAFAFPSVRTAPAVCVAENPDGSLVVEIVNPDSDKRQVQFFRNGSRLYVECLPNSINTVVFK
mgnify:CR=1 FL=1